MSAINKCNDSSSRMLPLEAVNAHASIAASGLLCVKYFSKLTELLRASDHPRDFELHISAVAIQDEFGRFKIWATNIGALQPASRSSSLEHRLREATKVKDHVIKLLRDLNHSLAGCISIVSGERPQSQSSPSESIEEGLYEEFSELSDSSDSGGSLVEQPCPTTELQQLFLAIVETITSLLKLSISIRRSTPRDRYARVASLKSPLDPSFDINHVYEKYPRLRSKPWLVEKLGKAITRRRDYLRYRERHHERLADSNVLSANIKTPYHHNAGPTKLDSHTISARGGPKVADVASSSADRSRLTSTIATTYIANSHNPLETASHSALSEISDITSVVDDHNQEARPIPDPPKESAGAKPFECPYCYTIQVIRKPSHWKKHVLSDLEPYVCTFENCSARLFQSLREWARHELENHRREWRCSLCSLEHFKSAKSLDDHIRDQHSAYTREQTSSMQSLSEQYPQVVPISACVFCDWPAIHKEDGTSHSVPEMSADLSTDSRSRISPLAKRDELSGLPTACPVVPVEQFQKHVGHHLEQLALFALPPPIKESSQTSSNFVALSHPGRGSNDESVSNTSAQSPTPVNNDPLPDLYVALTRGDVDLVEKLLQGGADANVRSPEGAGLLQVAAVFGALEALEFLLEAGADPNTQGGEYGNALQAVAAYDGLRSNALKLMLEAGADINLQGGKFGHALVAAAAIELHPGVEVLEPTWMVIRLLLDRGADPNAKGGMYGTALGASVARKDVDSVRVLLEAGADVNTQAAYRDWGSVLQIASWGGDVQMVRLLIDKGADINALGGYHGSAVQAASARGHSEVVQMLLERGADPSPTRADQSRVLVDGYDYLPPTPPTLNLTATPPTDPPPPPPPLNIHPSRARRQLTARLALHREQRAESEAQPSPYR